MDDPGDFSPRKGKKNNWKFPATPSSWGRMVPSLTAGGHASSSRSSKRFGMTPEAQSHKGRQSLFSTDILHRGLTTLTMVDLEEIMIGQAMNIMGFTKPNGRKRPQKGSSSICESISPFLLFDDVEVVCFR
ncbi:uncharacterized protein LOC125472211 [Pyrus x bretschneideri]|uniref:uncharacterized protein LOC125472211 n=1 Tax=Pyrus x bretschneideri TaxID=225117 RepID=UPI0020303323|nr:uncharacterized protein LOC125472211 [Pyrus x bretschneideri]